MRISALVPFTNCFNIITHIAVKMLFISAMCICGCHKIWQKIMALINSCVAKQTPFAVACVLVSTYQKVSGYEGFVKVQYELNVSKSNIEYCNVLL